MPGERVNATATVLCTDLVGSTATLARLGEAAFDEFRRTHFAALRDAVVWATGGGDGRDWLEVAASVTGSPPVYSQVDVRCGLGWVLRNSGCDIERADALYDEAVALALAAGDLLAIGWAHFMYAELASSTQRWDVAERAVRAADAAYAGCGSVLGMAWCRYYLGIIHIGRREAERAREELLAGLAMDGEAADDYFGPHVCAALAVASAGCGQAGDAERFATRATSLARRIPSRGVLVMVLSRGAQACLLSGRGEAATGMLRELVVLLRELGFRRWVADTLEMVAMVSDDAEFAATLLGAADSVRWMLAEPASVVLAEHVAACRRRASVDLGDAREEECRHRGRSLPTDEALELARRALGDLPVASPGVATI